MRTSRTITADFKSVILDFNSVRTLFRSTLSKDEKEISLNMWYGFPLLRTWYMSRSVNLDLNAESHDCVISLQELLEDFYLLLSKKYTEIFSQIWIGNDFLRQQLSNKYDSPLSNETFLKHFTAALLSENEIVVEGIFTGNLALARAINNLTFSQSRELLYLVLNFSPSFIKKYIRIIENLEILNIDSILLELAATQREIISEEKLIILRTTYKKLSLTANSDNPLTEKAAYPKNIRLRKRKRFDTDFFYWETPSHLVLAQFRPDNFIDYMPAPDLLNDKYGFILDFALGEKLQMFSKELLRLMGVSAVSKWPRKPFYKAIVSDIASYRQFWERSVKDLKRTAPAASTENKVARLEEANNRCATITTTLFGHSYSPQQVGVEKAVAQTDAEPALSPINILLVDLEELSSNLVLEPITLIDSTSPVPQENNDDFASSLLNPEDNSPPAENLNLSETSFLDDFRYRPG